MRAYELDGVDVAERGSPRVGSVDEAKVEGPVSAIEIGRVTGSGVVKYAEVDFLEGRTVKCEVG